MKKAAKIIVKSLASLILLILVLLFTVPVIFKDKIKTKVEEVINSSVNARVTFADYRLSFFQKAERLISEGVYTIIPMLVKTKIVGLLLFGLKHSGSHFAGKDLELLWAAANQATISIENARLYKSEVEKQKIERDLDLARKIRKDFFLNAYRI